MKNKTSASLVAIAALGFFTSLNAIAAPRREEKIPGFDEAQVKRSMSAQAEPWRLQAFLDLMKQDPARLLKIAEKLFNEKRIQKSRTSRELSYEWQDRCAMTSALSFFYDPNFKTPAKTKFQERASKILEFALLKDSSLLVRDSAVEALRRMFQMGAFPRHSKAQNHWKSKLEEAFLAKNNVLEGEGLFIRETILTALREASLEPSKRVKSAAQMDRSANVRAMLGNWSTNSFDSL